MHYMIQIPKMQNFQNRYFEGLWKRFAAFEYVRLTTHLIKSGHILNKSV